MNEPRRFSEDDIDALVRAYLERQATEGDAPTGLARIRATLDRESLSSSRFRGPSRVAKWWASAAAMAAAVLVAVHFGLSSRPAHASAEVIVREAQKVHILPVDRCYQVEMSAHADTTAPRFPLLAQPRTSRVWTRGDRFWIEASAGPRKWAWGQDEQGVVWLAIAPHLGIRFDAQEMPESLVALCDLYSMRLGSLLGELAQSFDLQRDEAGPGPASTHVIQAEIKAGRAHPNLRRATLEIDAETKVVKRLVVARTSAVRAAAITFTLVDTQAQTDARYQLEGHLEAPFKIYSRTFEPERRQFLLRRLGL